MKQTRTSILTMCALGGMSPLVSMAGDEMMAPAPIIPPPAEDFFSGSLNLDFNTHFISYGFDVWNGGNDFDASDSTFNPSLELNWAIGDFTAILGTWWDVNNNAVSGIGGDLQEIDVYAGGAYAFGDLSVSVIYQAWIYGGTTEDILDVGISYDTFLSPSLTIHNRLDPGASGGDEGTVVVLGLEYGFDLGPVSIGIPFNVAYFATDGYHGFDNNTGAELEDGYGYTSIGLTGSYALPIPEGYGAWDIHAGLVYYFTDTQVVNNSGKSFQGNDDFLTANVGISCAF